MAHELRRAFDAAGDPVVEERTYLFDDDDFEPLADRLGTHPWRHYITDRRGAPRRLADASGNVIESLEMDVWGYSTTSMTPIRLQGQYVDAGTGLSYNRYRYYSPDTGLYISPDPIGSLLEGTQFYGYTNDPVSIVDPFGLSKRTDYMGKTPGEELQNRPRSHRADEGEWNRPRTERQASGEIEWEVGRREAMRHGSQDGRGRVLEQERQIQRREVPHRPSLHARFVELQATAVRWVNRSEGASLGQQYLPPVKGK